MFSRLKFYYNFYCLISYFSKLSNISDDIDDNILNNMLSNLEYYIFNIGFIGIKYTQMYISKIMYSDNKIKKKISKHFENIFDNCPNHCDDYSKNLFQTEFNQSLDSYINMDTLTIFASGSIGQVYKAITKNGQSIAIKVKHPNINNELELFRSLMDLLKFAQKFSYLKKKFNLYFNCDDFYNHLVQQVNFNNEVENNKRFYDLYKDNDCVVFPRVINHTSNIIISTFEEGIDFTELSDYNKYQIATNFMCFVYNSALIENFIHGDLHIKNWKVRLNKNNQYVMILYDFGICFSAEDIEFTRELWDTLESHDPEILKNIIKKSFNIEFTSEINAKIDDMINEYIDEHKNVGFLLDKIFEMMYLQNNVFINKDLINILISVNFAETFILEYLDVFSQERGFMANRLNMISYCKANNSYEELSRYLDDCNKTKNNVSEKNFFRNNFNLNLKPPE